MSIQRIGDFINDIVRKRDFYAGSLMMLLGLGIALKGRTYEVGTLVHMGPGFMPTALGIILVILGVSIAGSATTVSEKENKDILPAEPQWRGWACILGGPISFMVLAHFAGFIPAAFACVFVSVWGDRATTLKSSLLLATIVTVIGAGLFSYLLQIPLPLLRWGI